MQKLSNEQRKLIEDNYQTVLTNLTKYFQKPKYSHPILDDKRDLPFQAVSYMVEAALSWNPDRSRHKKFHIFASQRCRQRFIDKWRETTKKNQSVHQNKVSLDNKNIDNFLFQLKENNDINKDQLCEYVKVKGEDFFNKKKNYNSFIHKELIKEYVIPYIKNDGVNISTAARKVGINKMFARNIIRGKKMKSFIKSIL